MGSCLSCLRRRQDGQEPRNQELQHISAENDHAQSSSTPRPSASSAAVGGGSQLYQATGDVLKDILDNCVMTNPQRKKALKLVKKNWPETFRARFGDQHISVILHNNDSNAANEAAALAPPRFCSNLEAQATGNLFLTSIADLMSNQNISSADKRHIINMYRTQNNEQFIQFMGLIETDQATDSEVQAQAGNLKPGPGEEDPKGSKKQVKEAEKDPLVTKPLEGGPTSATGGGPSGDDKGAFGHDGPEAVNVAKGPRKTIG